MVQQTQQGFECDRCGHNIDLSYFNLYDPDRSHSTMKDYFTGIMTVIIVRKLLK